MGLNEDEAIMKNKDNKAKELMKNIYMAELKHLEDQPKDGIEDSEHQSKTSELYEAEILKQKQIIEKLSSEVSQLSKKKSREYDELYQLEVRNKTLCTERDKLKVQLDAKANFVSYDRVRMLERDLDRERQETKRLEVLLQARFPPEVKTFVLIFLLVILFICACYIIARIHRKYNG